MSEKCPYCERDLDTITEDNPCDECAEMGDGAPNAFKELNFEDGTYRREYQPDFFNEDN